MDAVLLWIENLLVTTSQYSPGQLLSTAAVIIGLIAVAGKFGCNAIEAIGKARSQKSVDSSEGPIEVFSSSRRERNKREFDLPFDDPRIKRVIIYERDDAE